MGFSKFTPDEVERRRVASVAALQVLDRAAFDRRYQEKLDTFYWAHGKCCAGCDHWSSEAGDTGECYAAPPVSGQQVLHSMGIEFSSYIPAPGQPYTAHDHVCGTFKDDFDWSTLPADYLERIGYTPTPGDDDATA
jgi:hypothetical protein